MKKASAVLDANCERRADAIGEAVSRKLLADARQIIDTARANAVRSVDFNRVMMYWNLGRRVFEEEQHGKDRAEYGARIIRGLAERLEPEYGSGFGIRQLVQSRRFYRLYPIAHTLYAQLQWCRTGSSMCRVRPRRGVLMHGRDKCQEGTQNDQSLLT